MVSAKFLKIYKILCVTVLALIALGGSVRAMNAGLACPDWPLCFGDVIPDYHPQVYFEFIHRVLAGLVAIAIVIMNTTLLRNKQVMKTTKVLCWMTFLLLVIQIVMGGLTVLLQLHSKVVTLHLALGTGLFAITCWIYQSIKPEAEKVQIGSQNSIAVGPKYLSQTIRENLAGWVKPFAIFLAVICYGQILLGGLVASHYAALVCTDFPLCQGQFIPTFNGIIGLHVIHRLGAYFVFSMVLLFWILAWFNQDNATVRNSANILLALLFTQIAVGIANVLFYTPPLITVLHLTVGTLILGVATRLVFQVRSAQKDLRYVSTDKKLKHSDAYTEAHNKY